MQYMILCKSTDRYATDRGIEVKPQEIDAYVESLERVMEQDRKKREARRKEIARKLESKDLPQEERKKLSAELDRLNKFLADQDTTAGGEAEDPENVKAVHERLGSAFILQWKINRALYEQYGGRIVFQQGGPEPLDAYRKFLEEQEKQGAFKILKRNSSLSFGGTTSPIPSTPSTRRAAKRRFGPSRAHGGCRTSIRVISCAADRGDHSAGLPKRRDGAAGH